MIDGHMGMGGSRTITAPGGYETGDFQPVPMAFHYGPVVCDCGYGGRHSRFRHWFRLRFLKELWP